jgi:hypothetical protein
MAMAAAFDRCGLEGSKLGGAGTFVTTLPDVILTDQPLDSRICGHTCEAMAAASRFTAMCTAVQPYGIHGCRHQM